MSVQNFKDEYLKPKTQEEAKAESIQDLEELELIDKASDTEADEIVIETETRKEKARKALEDDLLNFLDEGGSRTSYRERLASVGLVKLKSIEFSKGWEYFCLPTRENGNLMIEGKNFETHEGIVAILKTPEGKTYSRAMRVTYDPEIDHGAITTLVVQCENTYDRVRGFSTASEVQTPPDPEGYKKTESGIYV